MLPTGFASLLALALAIAPATADEVFQNSTSIFEQYGRPGYYFPFPVPGPGDFLNFNNFEERSDEGHVDEQSVYEPKCGPLCAYSIPFAIQYNVSQPANVTLTPDTEQFKIKGGTFDLYSFAIGCVTVAVNGTDDMGRDTYGEVPSDCTVIANGYKADGTHVGGAWEYTASKNMTLVRVDDTWTGLEMVYWNGTARYSEAQPYKPVVVLDSIAHGVIVEESD